MSVKISWKANAESDNVAQYRIERSIVGVQTLNSAPFNIALGSNVQLRIDGSKLITVTLNAITDGAATAEQVALIFDNVLNPYGGSAKVTKSGDKVIVYSNRQTDRGSVNIKAGTALSGLGITPGFRKLQSDAFLIGTVAYPNTSFTDLDGDIGYQYRIIAENGLGEISEPTEWFNPFKEVIPTSVIYGNIVSADGKAIKNCRVEYGPPLNKRPSDDTLSGFHPKSSANAGIGIQFKEVFTDDNGYFQFIIPSNVSVRIKIDTVGHDFVYKSPTSGQSEDFTKLTEATSYESFALNASYWNSI